MPRLPLYPLEAPKKRPSAGHAGLWHSRFFNLFSATWETEEKAAACWAAACEGRVGDAKALSKASDRRLRLAQALGAETRAYSVAWRFVTGMGLPHPVENGFSWHPTLGVPYLGGSAVKGLLRAWVEEWAGLGEAVREQRLDTWFGTPKQAGCLIFFDALPNHCPRLSPDVMTPHMGKWYEKGEQITRRMEADRVPGDWHSPNPIHFLVVENATFLFTLAPRGKEGRKELAEAHEALAQALDLLGAGAKTAAGYGQLVPDPKALEPARQRMQDKAAADQKAADLAEMDPFERSLAELLAKAREKGTRDYVALVNALEAGRWQGEEARRVAEYARELMRKGKTWKEQTKRNKPEKDKPYQYTLKVQRWLANAKG